MLSKEGVGDVTGGGGRYGGGCLILCSGDLNGGTASNTASPPGVGMPKVFWGNSTGGWRFPGEHSVAYFVRNTKYFSSPSFLEEARVLMYFLNLWRASSVIKNLLLVKTIKSQKYI